MTATVSGAADGRRQSRVSGSGSSIITRRPGTRMWYLAIVVAATIVLYYEFYIAGAVSPEHHRRASA